MSQRQKYISLIGVAILLVFNCRVFRVLFPELDKVDSNWKSMESSHYHIWYRPDYKIERNLDAYARDIDYQFDNIRRSLEVSYNNKITCYLYESEDDFKNNEHSEMAGCAFPEFERIALYHPLIFYYLKHESVHVIAHWTIGTKNLNFLCEGLAEFVSRQHKVGEWKTSIFHENCRVLLNGNKILTLNQLADNEYFLKIRNSKESWCNIRPYDQSASFVGYLIGEYGLVRFKNFYANANQNNFEKLFELSYGKNIYDFEKEWHEFLNIIDP